MQGLAAAQRVYDRQMPVDIEPEFEEVEINAQNLIDAFNDQEPEVYKKLATMLAENKFESFGRMVLKLIQEFD